MGMRTKMEVTVRGKRDQTDAELLRASASNVHAYRNLYDRYAERIYG